MGQALSKAIFMLTLDFELLWGLINIKNERKKGFEETINFLITNKHKVRKSLNKLLQLFEEYRIPTTWATVGYLFHEDWPEEVPPACLPYKDVAKELLLARDVVEEILNNPIEHEIGYHGYTHVVFQESTREVCESEIKEGLNLAKELGIELKSFVFPQNKIAHVDILKRYGFKVYRGGVATKYSQDQNIVLKLIYGGYHTFVAHPVEPEWRDGIWEVKSSMLFLHPYFGSRTLLFKAKHGLDKAIKRKKVFHVHMHPHDVVLCESLMDSLDKFLKYVAKRRDEGKLSVMTMGQLAMTIGRK